MTRQVGYSVVAFDFRVNQNRILSHIMYQKTTVPFVYVQRVVNLPKEQSVYSYRLMERHIYVNIGS